MKISAEGKNTENEDRKSDSRHLTLHKSVFEQVTYNSLCTVVLIVMAEVAVCEMEEDEEEDEACRGFCEIIPQR